MVLKHMIDVHTKHWEIYLDTHCSLMLHQYVFIMYPKPLWSLRSIFIFTVRGLRKGTENSCLCFEYCI